MRPIRAFLCLFYCLWYPAMAALTHLIPATKTRRKALDGVRRLWADSVLALFHIKVKIIKPQTGTGGALYIANHSSYLDILILTASTAGVFISRDLFWWPVIGQMAYFGGTIFIDRSAKLSVADIIPKMRRKLEQGTNVVFFPEGTTGNGESLLPFKTPFFSAAKADESGAAFPIRPVTIKYAAIGGKPLDKSNRDIVFWYGDMSLLPHVWRLLAGTEIEVELRFLPEQQPVEERKALAAKLHEAMRSEMEESGAFV